MRVKAHIPNAVTLLNLLSGCIAVLFAVSNNFIWAACFVFIGIFFDFFDGFLARKLGVQGPLGLQLDSLADVVTSGVVPGVVMYKMLALSLSVPATTEIEEWNVLFTEAINWRHVVPLFGLFITLASAYRLARFNIDEDQQSFFKGLPTPANCLFIISIPLILEFEYFPLASKLLLNPWFLIFITILSCYILNASVPLFALKFKNYGWKGNEFRYILIITSVILLITLQFAAIPLLIILYIILSVISNQMVTKSKS
ncbi:CDP-alcohol phosphatidyltransferase family protein [Aegicerativicinus sediminis]